MVQFRKAIAANPVIQVYWTFGANWVTSELKVGNVCGHFAS